MWVTREFKYLAGEQCPEGSGFIQALGMLPNFSVAKGPATKGWTTRSRIRILEASKRLLERVQRDRDYIDYDYQCEFTAEGRRRRSAQGFEVRLSGRNAFIWLHPGQIFMEFRERGQDGKFHVVETIDLRRRGPMRTESHGLLKVYKRSNPINWEQKLPSLIAFLGGHSDEIVRVRHHYPKDPPP